MKTYSHQYNSTLSCDNVVYFPVSFTARKFPLAPTNITFIDKRSVETPNEISKANENTIAFWNLNEKDSENDKDGEVCEKKTNIQDHVSFKINKPQDELFTFGVWGRVYLRDVDHNKHISEDDIQGFNNILDVIYEAGDKNASD